jgi:hypothetical protein
MQVNDARKDLPNETPASAPSILAALLGDYSWQLVEVPIGAGSMTWAFFENEARRIRGLYERDAVRCLPALSRRWPRRLGLALKP